MGFAKKPTALGFPIRHRLIIGQPEGSIWGLGLENDIEACREQALEGLLHGFQIKESQGKGKNRLQVFIKDLETDDIDMVTVGFQSDKGEYTYFARTFCLSLCCPDFDHTKPIMLAPSKGNKEKSDKVVFCRLYQENKLLRTEWNPDIDCLKVLESLSSNFPTVSLYPSSAQEATETGIPIDEYEDPQPSGEAIDFHELMNRNQAALKQLGWTQEQGVDYLMTTYGKRSRQTLSDSELIEFTKYLERQVFLLQENTPF